MSTTDPFQSHPDGSFVIEGMRITAAHFNPPKPPAPNSFDPATAAMGAF